MSEEIGNRVFSSFFWKFAERILAQLISFVVSVVIARILCPEDYGIVAMGMVFINIANIFVSHGFSAALIQKKNADETDFSTLLYCSLIVSIPLYLILYFCAPIIANFYNNSLLIKLIRVFGLLLPISSYKSIQHAYVSKTLDFKKFFFSTLSGTIASAFVGIFLAIKGFGVWALVAQSFTNNIIDSLVLTFTINWKPKLLFSFQKVKPLLVYGSKVLATGLIGTMYNQLNVFLIGKKYTSADLAYYTKGSQFPDIISNNICASMAAILFPAFSFEADNKTELKLMCSRSISVSSYVLLPLYFGLMAVGSNMVEVLLTEKWMQCVPFLMIMCMNGIIGTIDIVDIQVLKALGLSGTVLKMEFIKKPIYIIITLIALRFNIFLLALTVPASSLIAIMVNSYFVNKYLGYSLWQKIKDSAKSFFSASFMFAVVYAMNYIHINLWGLLLLQIFVGIGLYMVLSLLLKNNNLSYCLNLLKVKK